VPLLAGREASGIACRSFRATVATLGLLTGLAEPGDLRPAVDGLADRIDGAAAWLEPMVTALHGAPSIDVLAPAANLGLAEQGALMLREAPRLPAHAWETADWLHTAVYLALPGHRTVLLPGSPADAEVVATVERRGGEVITLTPPDGSGMAGALVTSVVPELLAAALWQETAAIDKVP
jgi:glutamine---fructose-6-phosphate transaminase (isomerizing)